MRNCLYLSWLILFSFTLITAEEPQIKKLKIAFARDNYDIVKSITFQNMRGIEANHRIAYNYETKTKKKAFYVEGNGYQMGVLMGMLAHKDIEIMATQYIDGLILDFLKLNIDPKKVAKITRFLKDIVAIGGHNCLRDIPETYQQELKGMVAGCKKMNPKTKVTFNDLLILNVGIDVLFSKFYAVDNIWKTHKNVPFTPQDIRIPIMCNAFSVFGKATVENKHYFGRDFMFPTGRVYQDMACLIIYNPKDGRIPLVSMASPGFFGSMAAMNRHGIAMGVDVVAGGNCQPFRPGLNSLPMVRHTIHKGNSAKTAVKTVVAAQRGVSWLFPIADGTNDCAVVVESGATYKKMDFTKYIPKELKSLLPNQDFINRHENQKHQQGLMVRWNDYVHPQEFLNFNAKLFAHHKKKQTSKSWGQKGFINRTFRDKNCPDTFYFPPQRENKEDVLLVTNNYVIPSMRLCSMNPMTALVFSGREDKIQWRYDELNNQILSAYGKIDEAKAIELIDFLAPSRKFPDYYKNNKKSSDGKATVINGSVTLCSLSERILHSHFGYYKDEWITITLDNYLD